MNSTFITANQWMNRRFFLVPIIAIFFGSVMPLKENELTKQAIIFLFAYLTFITALGSSIKRFFSVLVNPKVPIWILTLVHFMSPVVGWLLGMIFFPNDDFVRTGFLISASIPVAVVSTMWTSITKGNVEVSLVAVTLDTFIGPILLPFFFLLVAGKMIQLDPIQMIGQLLMMVTIPSLIGMLINEYSKIDFSSFASGLGGLTSKAALFIVIYINSSVTMPKITWGPEITKLLLVVLLLVSCGYLLGFLGSFFLKERTRENTSAMVYNVGMRNISFGMVVALTYFPPAVAIPITLTMLFQQPVASIVALFFNRDSEIKSKADSSLY